jgi:hypothetical protein
LRVGEVLAPDVAGERCFSSFTIIDAAACAFAVSTVFDEPESSVGLSSGFVTLGLAQP